MMKCRWISYQEEKEREREREKKMYRWTKLSSILTKGGKADPGIH
jgi:hypothetical protein